MLFIISGLLSLNKKCSDNIFFIDNLSISFNAPFNFALSSSFLFINNFDEGILIFFSVDIALLFTFEFDIDVYIFTLLFVEDSFFSFLIFDESSSSFIFSF